MQTCFSDCIIGLYPISRNYIGVGSWDNTNTEEDGAEANWRQGSLRAPHVRQFRVRLLRFAL